MASVLVATAAGASVLAGGTGASGTNAALTPVPAYATHPQGVAHEAGHAEAKADLAEERKMLEAKYAAVLVRIETDRRAERSRHRAEAARAAAKAAAERRAKAAAIAEAKPRWVMPISGAVFTSGFGYRWGRMHQGDDFGAPVGTRLSAMSTGVVIAAGPAGAYGNKVEIRYADGTVSVYAHMDTIAVFVGQRVAPGETVGRTGNSGRSTGPHLHLEIHPVGGPAVDPSVWLRAKGLQA